MTEYTDEVVDQSRKSEKFAEKEKKRKYEREFVYREMRRVM